MLTDAGGAFARRRRDSPFLCLSRSLCKLLRLCLILLFYNPSLLSPCFHGVSAHKNNNNNGFPVKSLLLVRTVPGLENSVKENSMWFNRSPTAKSKICLSNIPRSIESKTFAILVAQYFSRTPSKSSMSSPSSSTEWSSALTPGPVMILTAEGLNLTLLRSPPYTCGGAINFSLTDATLGFLLMGLSHCCSPLLLARSIFENFSPSSHHSRPRFVCLILSPSPFIRLCRFYDMSSRRLWSFLETSPCNWSCEYSSQPLLFLSRKQLISLSLRHVRLSRHVHPTSSLTATIFRDYTLKHLKFEFIQQPQLRIVNSLFLLQPSRTMANCSPQNSGFLYRTSLLSKLKVYRCPSFLIVWFEPAIRGAKYPFPTSRVLLIVTISKIPEPFAEVSLTHHVLACGMLLASLCLRVYMILSSKLFVYHIYFMHVVRFASNHCICCFPFWAE